MNRRYVRALVLLTLAVGVQVFIIPSLFDRIDRPWRLGVSIVSGGVELHGQGLPWHLIMLMAHGVFVFVGLWGAASRAESSFWLYVLGYVVLYGILVYLAGDALLFVLLVMVYASVYHVPALVGCVFIFAVSFRLMAPYQYAVFALGVPVFLAVLGLLRNRPSRFLVGSQLIGFVLLVIILLPLAYMIFQTTPEDLIQAGGREDVRSAIWLSLKTSTITTLIVAVLGVPLAYVMMRAEFPGKGLVDSVLDLPILIPQPVVAIAILTFAAGKTRLGRFLLETFGFQFDGTLWGIVAAQVFVSTPFLVRAAMTAFDGIDPKLERVARTLGARPWQAFFTVTLPLAAKGIFAGCILTWSRAISEFGAVAMITYDPQSAPVKIADEVTAHGVPEARPTAVLLVLTCLWIFVILRLIRAYPVKGTLAGFIRRGRATDRAGEATAGA